VWHVEEPCRLQLVSCGARNVRDGWVVDETYKKEVHPRDVGLPSRRCDRQPRTEHYLLVDADDRHQRREDERPDDEADDAECQHYQEPNPQGKLVRCTRGELRYSSRRRRKRREVSRRLKKKKLRAGALENGVRPPQPRRATAARLLT